MKTKKMESMHEKATVPGRCSRPVTCLLLAFRIILFLILMFAFAVALFEVLNALLPVLFPMLAVRGLVYDILTQGCMFMAVLLAAAVMRRGRSGFPAAGPGLSLRGRGKDILWGAFAAAVIYAVGFGILYAKGEVEVVAVHFDLFELLLSWVLMLLVALSEETAYRGFVLGHLQDAKVNRFAALLVSAVLFSLVHAFNWHFSYMAFLNLLLAGVMLGASYIYTRNLWFPISLHLFWNWVQGPVLGFGVSGQSFGNTLLALELPEENLINGGAFGFEGSLLCTALVMIAIAVILRVASRQSACAPCPRSTPVPVHADE